ncbi:MAG: hypothetical protein DSY35_03830 [Desulfurobacterium sp.]|nr:MAG: hypothetical protein DSY35_03830 [Desulfurobacterium sp.]
MQGSLFSSYFLEEGIRETEDWKRVSSEELQDFFLRLSELFSEVDSFTETVDEADTEDTVIRPVLELLGFSFFRQKSISKKRLDVPDFVLFGNEEDREEFARGRRWNKALAILEAKRWDRDVERDVGQILRYLSVAEVESNGKVVWGILTNGRVWRLYYHKFPSRAEGYVEFNLEKAVRKKDVNTVKLFYLLLRKEAFTPTEWRRKSFLELALEEGKKWEERVSENLENRVFFDVFPSIAKGFIENAVKKGRKRDDELLKEVYENTLILLYRILFLFYAEDRGLLPVYDENYRPYSFTRIREEIAELLDSGKRLSCKFFFYDRLKNLFKIVDKGDKSLRIPPYNGGLFKPETHPFLESYAVPDKYLVPAIDKLSRERGRFINYRDLSVRQLGSIYEGLLEFKLKLAEKPLKVGRRNGAEVYKVARSEKEAVIKAGEVYLTNEREERKSSGSYYTPDHVVQAILRKTVEGFVEKKLKRFYEKVSELKKLKGQSAKWKTEELKKFDPAVALLELKVLDPAMGSGHFLVGAVDYLSDRALELMYEVSGKVFFGNEVYESPLVQKLRKIREKILQKAEEKGYRVDGEKLSDKNLVKRIVLKRCIYGVDLNPLAVELAKVSLWLHTFTVGAPLSFLDHHLKCGNSLIGADPESFEELFTSSLFGSRYAGLFRALELLERVQELTDADISEVEESERIYRQVTEELKPYRKVLDLFVARHFLNNGLQLLIDGTKGNPLDVVEGKVNLEKDGKLKELLEKALKLAEEKRFFHWELEFPEVWQRERRGFDIVLGNPPYVRIQELKRSRKEETSYFGKVFKTPEGSYDLYVLFIEKGLSLLNGEGILGFIVPNKFTKLNYGKKLRELTAKHLDTFIDFGDNQVFPKQTTYTGLLFLTKEERETAKVSRAPKLRGEDEIKRWLAEAEDDFFEVSTLKLGGAPWILISKREGEIVRKMESVSLELKEFVKDIIVGVQTSADEVYILELLSDKISYYEVYSRALNRKLLLEKELLKPLLSGENIERYFIKGDKKLLLFPYRTLKGKAELIPEEELKEEYPRIWEYLKENEKRLRSREYGKFNNEEWYKHGRHQNLEKQESQKLIVPRLCNRLKAFFDEEGKYYLDNVDVNGILLNGKTEISPLFLLALLNSKALDWRFKIGSVPFRGGYFSANKQFLSPLPVPKIDFSDFSEKELKELKENFLSTRKVLKLLDSINPRSKTVHDFLSFLAEKMVETSEEVYLIERLLNDELPKGSPERLKALSLIGRRYPSIPEVAVKEAGLNLLKELRNQKETVDALIDRIVLRMFNLEEEGRFLCH